MTINLDWFKAQIQAVIDEMPTAIVVRRRAIAYNTASEPIEIWTTVHSNINVFFDSKMIKNDNKEIGFAARFNCVMFITANYAVLQGDIIYKVVDITDAELALDTITNAQYETLNSFKIQSLREYQSHYEVLVEKILVKNGN